ncbi:MAG: hypothetical protein KDI09_15230, partial [Halioglobus sp.]|nr:hypothetical protein [Halioglobus sp.]
AFALALLGVGLAFFCQFAQLFTPGRDPSLADLSVDTLGIALGWIAGLWLPLGSSAAARGLRSTHHLPLVLAGFWLASQLLPLVPSIDLQLWKDALKPLFFPQRWYWQGALVSTCCWLVCFHLLEHKVGWALSVSSLLLGAAIIIGLKVVVVGNRLELVFVSALSAAILLWSTIARQWRGEYLVCALLLAFALDMVAPLSSRSSVQAFSWLPFAGYLQGSMLTNATALSRKLFVFGAFALLFLRDRPRRLVWTLAVGLCLLLLEFAQRFVGYGTPALTDPLLFLATTWFVVTHSARAAVGGRA